MHKKLQPSFLMLSPAVIVLLAWMIVPLSMTIYFSLIRYNLLYPGSNEFIGLMNYEFFITDEAFWPSVWNTLVLVGSVLAITVTLGLAIASLINGAFPGQGIVRVLLISPFFIMPTVNALMWKNMFYHPVYGMFAWLSTSLGFEPIDWLSEFPMFSIIFMIAWQWLPFAILVFMTALQSQDQEQMEAAEIDGANAWDKFRFLTLPHMSRPITVVIMIQTIFLLSVFAEIFVTTGGGPGTDTTNLAFLVYTQALMQYDVGVASAGGLFAIILANIVAWFIIKLVGESLDL